MHITLSTVGQFLKIVASFIEHYLTVQAQKVEPTTTDETPTQSQS
ncbi:MAG: hypothetical protein V7K67_18115 [Nostoc sp.]